MGLTCGTRHTESMPELPEVETIVRGLRPSVTGERIRTAEFQWARTCVGDPDYVCGELSGQVVTGIRRWGKYLVFDLEKAGAASVMVVHLRMTGNLLLSAEPGPWTRATFVFSSGKSLIFNDIRKFGRIEWARDLPTRLLELGPEPLEIGIDEFVARLRRRSAQVKAVMLNQEFVRGLGNIYCDEALFRAGIHPRASTARLGRTRATRLHAAIQEVLIEAIEQGGSTIANFVNSEGAQGYFQLRTAVYGKTGEACKVCSRPIRKIIVASRSTHYCSRCQRR